MHAQPTRNGKTLSQETRAGRNRHRSNEKADTQSSPSQVPWKIRAPPKLGVRSTINIQINPSTENRNFTKITKFGKYWDSILKENCTQNFKIMFSVLLNISHFCLPLLSEQNAYQFRGPPPPWNWYALTQGDRLKGNRGGPCYTYLHDEGLHHCRGIVITAFEALAITKMVKM